jgi:hypothetical protein
MSFAHPLFAHTASAHVIDASRQKGLRCFKVIAARERMAALSEERLPLLSQSPMRSQRRRNIIVAAVALALIALSLLAADARSHFVYSTILRGNIVSFPNGDLKTITVTSHRQHHDFPAEAYTTLGYDAPCCHGQLYCPLDATWRFLSICIPSPIHLTSPFARSLF